MDNTPFFGISLSGSRRPLVAAAPRLALRSGVLRVLHPALSHVRAAVPRVSALACVISRVVLSSWLSIDPAARAAAPTHTNPPSVLPGLADGLHEQLPARPQSIGHLRRAIAEFADSQGASAGQCATIALAVSEAVTNAVLHAYVDCGEPGVVALHAQTRERSLQVAVCDAGSGMRPRSDSPGLGLGLAMIAQVTEELTITDTTPGMCVHMRFAIS